MGIVNVTPDSFSDGGKFLDPEKAVAHALKLVEEGADLLDIGGQSTRPGSEPVSADEELRRVRPVLESLLAKTAVPISIDTFYPGVAEFALEAGVEVVNDVAAFRDRDMLRLAVQSGCGVVAMHLQGEPKTMQDEPQYDDVVVEVLQFLRWRRDALVEDGVELARIALDPGIGFGKTLQHNLELLANSWRFHALDCPLLFGHSRKRFIGQLLDQPSTDRLPGTLGAALALARQNVQILRVHDVAAVRQAMLLFEAAGGL
ncbi:MAG: dihydropteroate synthase [Pirellulales bacterium]|nr:dihydropteroate synthase [Pirellulales bacterium]